MKASQVVFSVMTILSTLTAQASVGDTLVVTCKGSVDKSVSFKGYLGGDDGKIALRYKNDNERMVTKTVKLTLTSRPDSSTGNYSYTSDEGDDATNFEIRVRRSVIEKSVQGVTQDIQLVIMPEYTQSERSYELDCNVVIDNR